MTREEAIKRLKEARNTIQPFRYIDEAIDYAVKVLEQELCEDAISRECNNCAYYVNGANDEACDGCFEDEYEHPNFKPKAQYCEDAIKYFNTIYELSQTLGVSYSFIKDEIEEITKTFKLPKELCNDAISRQDAIDALCEMLHDCFGADEEELDAVITTLNELSPVTSAEKVGHWIEQIDHEENCRTLICSNCDRPALHDGDSIWKHKFCPHCGSRMMQEVKE